MLGYDRAGQLEDGPRQLDLNWNYGFRRSPVAEKFVGPSNPNMDIYGSVLLFGPANIGIDLVTTVTLEQQNLVTHELVTHFHSWAPHRHARYG